MLLEYLKFTLAFPCSLHSATWKLGPIYQRTLNLTLLPNSKDIHSTVNHSIADLFQEHIKQDPLVWGLAEMEAVDRKQIEMSALLQPVAVPQPISGAPNFGTCFGCS